MKINPRIKSTVFHDHIAICKHCTNKPYGLCKKGNELLKRQTKYNLKIRNNPEINPEIKS